MDEFQEGLEQYVVPSVSRVQRRGSFEISGRVLENPPVRTSYVLSVSSYCTRSVCPFFYHTKHPTKVSSYRLCEDTLVFTTQKWPVHCPTSGGHYTLVCSLRQGVPSPRTAGPSGCPSEDTCSPRTRPTRRSLFLWPEKTLSYFCQVPDLTCRGLSRRMSGGMWRLHLRSSSARGWAKRSGCLSLLYYFLWLKCTRPCKKRPVKFVTKS